MTLTWEKIAYEKDVVLKSLFDADSILAATSDNTPVALSLAEQTIVGRKTGGHPAALTGTEVRTLLGLATGDSPVFATVKLSGLTDGYFPYHVDDATGFANSPIWTNGAVVVIGATSSTYKFEVHDGTFHINYDATPNDTAYEAQRIAWGADGTLGPLELRILGKPSANGSLRYAYLDVLDNAGTYRALVFQSNTVAPGVSIGFLPTATQPLFSGLTLKNNNQIGWVAHSNAASRRWQIWNDGNAYGDFQIGQSTTQYGTTYTPRLYFSPSGQVGVFTNDPKSTFQVDGGVAFKLVTVNSSPYTILATDFTIIVNDTAATRELDFPDASACPGRILCIYFMSGAFNTALDPYAGDTVAGADPYNNAASGCVMLQSDGGTNWILLSFI